MRGGCCGCASPVCGFLVSFGGEMSFLVLLLLLFLFDVWVLVTGMSGSDRGLTVDPGDFSHSRKLCKVSCVAEGCRIGVV